MEGQEGLPEQMAFEPKLKGDKNRPCMWTKDHQEEYSHTPCGRNKQQGR